jgi:hypothetical protein
MIDALWSIATIALACIIATIILLEILNRGRLIRAIGSYVVARGRRCLAEWQLRR